MMCIDRFIPKEPDCCWIVGVGSALVDILAHESEDFLNRTGAQKGGMRLVDKAFIEDTLDRVSNKTTLVPGGSACNTAVGVGMLGGKARFVGTCGNGRLGELFRKDLERSNVQPALFQSDAPTGRVLSIITPDAQRSMFTYLGAAAETQPHQITTDCFENAAVAHIEGYLLYNLTLFQRALSCAKEAGAAVSLDLASYNVVEESLADLKPLVKEYVDILIANEDEARAFTNETDEKKALIVLGQWAAMAVLKVGQRGSYICYNGKTVAIPPAGTDGVKDTTGAGDLWAAGLLYGLVSGLSLEKCGSLASSCGYEVCRVIGTNIPAQGWARIKQSLASPDQNGKTAEDRPVA
jgi:sugar/nucleoside kinase (ribokinase family)